MSLFVDIEKNLGSFFLKTRFEAENETIALLGASGCGKSMTLKCIAGIEKPDRGRIVVDDVVLFDSEKGINLSPQERKTGLLFQNYALFPNMTVEQNIIAGANREKDARVKKEMVKEILERFQIEDLAKRHPHQLSGGQQQRVALARILVSSPRILLLDEPFSALDSHLRFRLEREVRQVIRNFGRTAVLVSHDRDEVFRMSDRIAIMHDGKIDVCGAKSEVFKEPKTENGAILTGCKDISRAKRIDKTHVEALDWGVTLTVPESESEVSAIGIRQHDICCGELENSYPCIVKEEIENPFSYTIMMQPEGAEDTHLIGWELSKEEWERIRAEKLSVSLPPEALLLLQK